jgi:hypothetical protein
MGKTGKIDMAKEVLHTGEVARILGLPTRTVSQLAKKKALPVLERLGKEGHYRYPANQILELKEQWSQSAAKFRKPQEVEKVEAKELAKALNVSWLMSRFLSCLRTPDPCQIHPVGTEQIELDQTSWVEEHPLFPELKRLLDNKFWEKFNNWKKLGVEYFKECVSFLDDVRQKAEEESQMKTTEYWEKEGLNDTFWQRIYTHALLKTNPQPLNELDRGYFKRLDVSEFVIKDNDLIVEGENCVLAKGEPLQLACASKTYWSLVAGFTSASGPKQIWALWQEVNKTEKFLNAQAEAVYREIVPNWFRYREIEI